MKSILRSLAVLAVLVGFTSSSFAQDDDIIRPITKQGSAAFLMTIAGLGTFNLAAPPLGPGLGQAGFGFKYFLADDVALRVLLGVSMNSETTPSNVDGVDDVTETSSTFGVGVGAEYHFRPLYSTDPYIGAQIGFATSNEDNGLEDAAQETSSRTHISVAALAGFNWFFTRGISIGGEYSLGFTSITGTHNANDQESDLPSNTMVGLAGVGTVNLNVFF